MTLNLTDIQREVEIQAVLCSDAMRRIAEEVVRARRVHPAALWKGHHATENRLIQAGVVLREASEMMEAALNHAAYQGDWSDAEEEAVQTAATCVRLLEGE